MNLSLSKRADYVIKAGIALARSYDGDSFLKVRQIAAEMAIPRSYTPQILDALIQQDLVESRAGKTGGYRLTRHPDTISVLELLEAGEGPMKSDKCALSEGPCRWDNVCPLHDVMSTAVNRFRDTMAGESLSDLASRDLLLERGELEIPLDPHERKNRIREFAVSSSTGVDAPRLDVLARLQTKDGEWLAEPMRSSIAEAVSAEGLDSFFALEAINRANLVVNLGYVHEQGVFINIPVTFEGVKSRLEIPRFVGNLSLESLESGKTKCQLSGRFEFHLISSGDSEEETLSSLHIQLDLLASRICGDFLNKVADQAGATMEVR